MRRRARAGMTRLLAAARAGALAAHALTVAGLAACGDARPPPGPPSFERPNRIAFACVEDVDDAQDAVVPLARCAPAAAPTVDEDGPDYDLHAFVTQGGRGEVAAVNLEDGLVVDSRRDVPGFTFVPVGELPTGIAVPAEHSGLTYVANAGSRDLYVLRTQAFLSLPPGASPVVQIVPIAGRESEASPVDVVLSPEEDALFVAVPGLGAVFRMPLRRSECDPEAQSCCEAGAEGCEEGLVVEAQIQRIELAGSRDLASAPPAASAGGSGYQALCGFERPDAPPPTGVLLDDAALVPAPRPVAFAIDAFCREDEACTRRLLVADEALPLVHAIDLDGFAVAGSSPLLDPIVVGVPTSDVAVTPRVPASLDAPDTETQFVYVIDATDGSVVALEDGRVLSIDADPNGRPDRMPVGRPSAQLSPDRVAVSGTPAAAALEVLTPGFDPTGPAAQYVTAKEPGEPECDGDEPEIDADACVDCDHPEQNPGRLRGVFLAVAMTDGTVRIVDVHDMELAVRDPTSGELLAPGESPCRECTPNPVPLLVRHHPRVAVTFVQDEEEETAPALTPFLTNLGVGVLGRRFIVRSDGTTNSPDLPGLECLRCDDGLEHLYPNLEEDTADAGVGATEGPDAGLDAGLDAGVDLFVDSGADAGLGDGGVDLFDRCPEETPSLLCTVTDPWFDIEELWSVVYEGVLPGSAGGAGLFSSASDSESGAIELSGDADFCAAGVLGRDDDPEGIGDQLVITGDVVVEHLLAEADLEDCETLQDALDNDEEAILLLPIDRAYRDRLVLGSELIQRIDGSRIFTEDLLRCSGGAPLAFHVRVRGAYTVVGSRSGFAHTVAASARTGRCRQPADADPIETGRAYSGRTFRNGRLELALRVPEPGTTPRLGAEIFFSLVSPARKLLFDANLVGFSAAAVVPVELRFNPVDGLLYLIDEHDRGLIPIPLDPFPAQSNFSYQ